MFVQDVICSSVSCATCYWCFYPFATHLDCLWQNGSVPADPRSLVCPNWFDRSSSDASFLDSNEYTVLDEVVITS